MVCADPLFRQGWYRYAGHRPSPHCDARPEGMRVDLLVLHNISLPAGEFGSGKKRRKNAVCGEMALAGI